MVNSIAELEGRSDILEGRGDGFRERPPAAFANPLAGALDTVAAHEQTRLLTATTLGGWLTARSDPAEAADLFDVAAPGSAVADPLQAGVLITGRPGAGPVDVSAWRVRAGPVRMRCRRAARRTTATPSR